MQNFDVLSNPKHLITKSTVLGGIMTTLCLLFAVLLCFKELKSFQGVRVNKLMYLDSKSYEEKIRVWLKVRLMKTPCGVISLDVYDELEHHRVDVPLTKTKLNSSGGREFIGRFSWTKYQIWGKNSLPLKIKISDWKMF